MKDHVSLLAVRGRIGVAVGIALVLAACAGGDDETPDPTVPTAVSTTSTTATPDVSVIPDRIDEPYLNAVLAALDQVDGDATRIIHSTKRLPPDAADLLNAIYSDEWFRVVTDNWFESLGMDPQLGGIRANPGNRRTTVERVISASPQCVWIAVRRDRSAVNVEPGPTRTEYVSLQPLDPENNKGNVNPTPWMITGDGYRQDGSEPSNPCSPA
jgi:hypothetical protein